MSGQRRGGGGGYRDPSAGGPPEPPPQQAEVVDAKEAPARDERPVDDPVAKTGAMLRHYLTTRMDLIAKLTRKDSALTAQILVRACELIYRTDPEKMRDQRSWPSILLSLMTAAQLDLEPGGKMGDAYLVPYWDKNFRMFTWSLMPGYRGLIKLALKSGKVASLRAFPVFERDTFSIEQGTTPHVRHVLWTGEDRGNQTGVYAVGRMTEGDPEFEWVPYSVIAKIAKEQSTSPAWRAWPDEMSRKVAIKRLSKQLPAGAAFQLAVTADNAATTHDDAERASATAEIAESLGGADALRALGTGKRDPGLEAMFDRGSRGGQARSRAESLGRRAEARRGPAVVDGRIDVEPSTGWGPIHDTGEGEDDEQDLRCPRCDGPKPMHAEICDPCAEEAKS